MPPTVDTTAITDVKAVERQGPWHRECYFLTSGTQGRHPARTLRRHLNTVPFAGGCHDH